MTEQAPADRTALREDTRPVLTSRALRRTFLDLLGRPPLEVERERWLGKARETLVDVYLATRDFWQNWLEEQLYYFLLVDNFRPTTDGVRTLPELLASGRVGVREAIHRICLSSSFDRRNPGPDTFVTVVMEQLLGLTVQRATRELEIGKRVYDGTRGTFLGKPGNSQADIVNIAISDPRALTYLLMRESRRLLRRVLPVEEMASLTECLARDDLAYPRILRKWLLSTTYDERLAEDAPLPNRIFVRALHVDLLGRVPEEVEAQRFRTALDGLANSKPLRALLAKLMLDSGKAPCPDRNAIGDSGAWIRAQFERLLGRLPTPSEFESFHRALQDPACRSSTVLYALVSHPEYQTW
jgi:hypothetical protein